ncbi:MAG: hypothetical protein ACTSQH_02470 [Candidatus Hodarchaeales archaeon]
MRDSSRRDSINQFFCPTNLVMNKKMFSNCLVDEEKTFLDDQQ